MRRVVVLAEAAEDLEEARRFYDAREPGVGDYCVTSLLADIESLASHHGVASPPARLFPDAGQPVSLWRLLSRGPA